jgi:hypothetical protein
MKNKPKKRIYIYEETYNKIMQWAKDDFFINKTRAPNGRMIFYNFPFALEEWIKRGKK